MKACPNCHAALADDAAFCTSCGTPVAVAPVEQQPAAPVAPAAAPAAAPMPAPAPYGAPQGNPYAAPAYAPVPDMNDHTAEYDPKDISENKVYCMLCYLMGVVGIIIALLASKDSPFAQFHIRQAVKFQVVTILTGIVTAVLCWTVIVPIAGFIFLAVLLVLQIICFFQICKGQAKNAAIIRSLNFLK